MNPREVLIIEDKLAFRNWIKRALKPEGYTFVEATTIDQGLKICAKGQGPSVILLDLNLPDGTGRDFLERLGSARDQYKIIVITAHEDLLGAELADKLAVFTYLPKTTKLRQPLRFTVTQAFNEIERAQLKDKNRILNQIQEKINSSIQESDSIEEIRDAMNAVLKLICDSVRELVGAYTSHIRVYDLQKGDFHLAAFAGPDESYARIFALPKRKKEPFSGLVAEDNEKRHFEDLQSEKEFQEWRGECLARISREDVGALSHAESYFTTVKSAFIAPITTNLFAKETDAVFNVSADSLAFFSEDKQAVVMEFVHQATAAITKAWQKAKNQGSHQDYKNINDVLTDISKELRGENVKPKIYRIVIQGIAQIIKPEAISLFIYNKETELLDNVAEYRGGEQVPPRIKGHPTNVGLTPYVWRTALPLRVPNFQIGDHGLPADHPAASKDLYAEYVELLPSHRVDHYLGVPMIIGKDAIGAIQLLNKTSAYYGDERVGKDRWLLERGFSDDCRNVLGIAASHLAVAIRNSDLWEEGRKQISQLAILKDVGRFTTTDELGELLHKINAEAAEAGQAELCLLFLLDESKTKVELAQRYGISEQEMPEGSYQIGKGLTGTVAKTGKSLLFKDKVPPGKYDKAIKDHLRRRYGQAKTIESLMIVPIKAKENLLGVIKVINKKAGTENDGQDDSNKKHKEHKYDQSDLKFFEEFASYVGIAIENTQRYESALKRLTTLEGTSTLSNLVASTGHEINNTHGLIPGYLNSLRKLPSFPTDPKAKELLERVENVAMEAVFYANEIGGYSIGKRGEQELLEINEIVQVAKDQIPAFKKPRNYKEISVTFEPSPSRLLVRIHKTPLVQTIRNIIINAYQSFENREPGLIAISTEEVEGMAIIKVKDNGCGIEKQFASQVYEPDFTTKSGSGSGIGLWLAKRYLDSVGGEISFTSEKGAGTTFVLKLPLNQESYEQ